jgi:hypothetical protein
VRRQHGHHSRYQNPSFVTHLPQSMRQSPALAHPCNATPEDFLLRTLLNYKHIA